MSKNLDSLITQWKAHKYKKPVRGGIILNEDLTKVLEVCIHACPVGNKECRAAVPLNPKVVRIRPVFGANFDCP